ncbi:MAG: DAK2 domain-containing protein [Defluviitaleaceae bacterium]|nr:DAK2 domain-containing protein [Defluviitaleaceae bacterium]
MGLISIDGNILRKMIIGGANEVTRNMVNLNALNVFPVPDGDTGTNMSHTIMAAAKEVYKLSTPSVADVAKAASSGALRGARGNSGVITSQLFRGFAKGLEGKTTATAEDLAEALAKSSEMAYKAVMKPKEGTMLTIARSFSEAAHEVAFDEEDIAACLKFVIERGDETLAKTPDMLPVLKQAGVVDSGGMGLVLMLKGALAAMDIPGDIEILEKPSEADSGEGIAAMAFNTDDIKFAYCTEFLVELDNKPKLGRPETAENVLLRYLPTIGDSVVVIEDEGLVKVHVHTNNPGKALEKAMQFGGLNNIKIDNMKAQHTGLIDFSEKSQGPPKPLGIMAVVAGSGLKELFTGLGADIVIDGGQSMNPSTDDIAKAIARVNAEHVIVLPNNKNIILTAQQAAELVTDKTVHVLPTMSIPQGVACVMYNSDTIPLDDNLAALAEHMAAVHSGQITEAVRDTILDGHEIMTGDALCLYDGQIVLVEKNIKDAARALASYMLNISGDIMTIYAGEGVTMNDAEELAEYIRSAYPSCDVEVYEGKQPIYGYILSVE